ncbi:S8 family peptidase [Tropicibacter sp. S64]|uniref:S8 family peptidase n=1 Tax=Tropicibacter sp. S64 TaxID=3415122 RepID=UPI003C7D2903
MARYLALPRNDIVVASLSLADVSPAPEARARQVARVKSVRRSIGVQNRGMDPVSALSSLDATLVAHPEETTSATGVMVFDMEDPDALDSLRQSLPEYDVVEDLPLSIIPPVASGLSVSDASAVDAWHLDAVGLTAARDAGFTGRGTGVGVAILDTGIKAVPEIDGRITTAWELDRTTNTPRAITTRDTDGHGTHVAGLVAGSAVGVAPGADLMNYVMLPRGLGNVSDFIFALDFVVQQPEVSIINMSAGLHGYDGSMKPTIALARRMGVLPVIAVGNEGPNTTRSPGNYADVLAVGASTRDGRVWSSSGGGTLMPDGVSYSVPHIVAPGKEVCSCVMGGGYEAWNGSSMATPIVSGMAALILEAHPQIALADLIEELVRAARKLPSVPDIRQGAGLMRIPPIVWHLGT